MTEINQNPAKKKKRLGHPPKYKNAEELQIAIDNYFSPDNNGYKKYSEVPTITGLALFLGFADRQSIIDNAERGKSFSCVIKNAINRLMAIRESNISKYTGQVAGDIFWLKNHGWKDENTQNIKAEVTTIADVIRRANEEKSQK